jgi:hypothetical protein
MTGRPLLQCCLHRAQTVRVQAPRSPEGMSYGDKVGGAWRSSAQPPRAGILEYALLSQRRRVRLVGTPTLELSPQKRPLPGRYLSYRFFSHEIAKELEASPALLDRSALRVLVIGCGNSSELAAAHRASRWQSSERVWGTSAALSDDLDKDGFGEVVSIDYSAIVISKMSKLYAHKPRLKCEPLRQRAAIRVFSPSESAGRDRSSGNGREAAGL